MKRYLIIEVVDAFGDVCKIFEVPTDALPDNSDTRQPLSLRVTLEYRPAAKSSVALVHLPSWADE